MDHGYDPEMVSRVSAAVSSRDDQLPKLVESLRHEREENRALRDAIEEETRRVNTENSELRAVLQGVGHNGRSGGL